jgi:hypothetical protein
MKGSAAPPIERSARRRFRVDPRVAGPSSEAGVCRRLLVPERLSG